MAPVIAVRHRPGEDFRVSVEARLRDLCAPYGTVTHISISYDDSFLRPVGVAFVDMETLDQASRAVEGLSALPFANGLLFHFQADGTTLFPPED